MSSLVRRLCVCAVVLALGSCSVLVGNVSPVAEKSDDYGILDLSNQDPDWTKLDSAQSDDATITDISYQSKKTASTITLNSACKESLKLRSQTLSSYTKSLFLGLSHIDYKEEKEIILPNGTPALQTTVRGKLNREYVMLRAIVFKKESCLYDLLYVARPNYFKTQESTFTQFVHSLRLK